MRAERNPAAGGRLDAFRKAIFRKIARRELDPKIVDTTGARPILVVDEHELVSNVFIQAARTGGFANLFVVTDRPDLISASLLPRDEALFAAEAEEVETPIHQDLEIGMLMAAAGSSENGLNVKIRLPEQQGELRDAKRLAPA